MKKLLLTIELAFGTGFGWARFGTVSNSVKGSWPGGMTKDRSRTQMSDGRLGYIERSLDLRVST
jgi:hypothetical protein